MACAPSKRSAWASAQSDQSLLCAHWIAKDPSFLHADSEDSDFFFFLIVLGFNDTSTLVGHFVSSPREREKRDRRDSRRDEREDREERGTGVKVKKKKK